MGQRNATYFNKKTALFFKFFVLCWVLCCPFLAQAGNYTNCIPSAANGKYTTECPNGQLSRNDINVQCVRNQNQNSCLNTMPVAGSVARIPEDVCYRNAGWSKKRNHNGIDYAAGRGTPVVAAADGVATVNNCVSGGGRTVIITHKKASSSSDGLDIVNNDSAGSYTTIYMHLASINVSNGTQVKKGQQIGTVGGSSCSNGRIVENAYGDHLHFEMRDGSGGVGKGSVLDPLCSDIQSLCEPQSSNMFYQDVSTSGYSPFQCRNCGANPAACQNTGNNDYSYIPSDPIADSSSGSLASGWDNSGAMTTAQQIATPSDGKCAVADYRSTFDTCLFCDIFKILFNTASRIAKMAYDTLAHSVAVLVLVGTALWLAFLVLKQVSSLETKDPRNLVKEIVNQLFVVLVVEFFLLGSNSVDFMNLVVNPIFQTGMNLANISIADSAGNTCNAEATAGIIEDGGLPASIGTSIVCVVDAIQNRLADVIAVGSTSMCVGVFVESWRQIPILPHFGYLLSGIVIWIFGWLMLLIYPWLLIDALLQLCLAVMFLPIAIGSYAFKYTRQMFVGKVWGAFMSAMFMFVFLALIIAILIMAIDLTLGDAFNKTLTESGNTLAFTTILQNIGWWTVNFLKIVFTLFLGYAVLGEAQTFAKEFASGIGASGGISLPGGKSSIGQRVGTLFNSGLKGTALGTANLGKKALKAPMPLLKEKFNDFKVARQKKKMDKRQQQFKDKGTTNKDGSVSYTNRWGRKFTQTKDGYSYKTIFGRTVTKSVTQNNNGTSVVTKERVNRDGSKTTVSNDGYIQRTIKTDTHGQKSEQFTMVAAAGRSLIKPDGSLNQIAINNITQNSGFAPEEVQEALMHQMMRERFAEFDAVMANTQTMSKSVQSGVDKQGNKFFSVSTQNADGSKSVMTMTFNKKGNRAMTSWERVDQNGKAIKKSSDGILNRQERYSYNKDGTINNNTVDVRYSATKYYTETRGKVVDSNGKVARGVPIEDSLFTEEDLQEFGQQVAQEGSPKPLSGFK